MTAKDRILRQLIGTWESVGKAITRRSKTVHVPRGVWEHMANNRGVELEMSGSPLFLAIDPKNFTETPEPMEDWPPDNWECWVSIRAAPEAMRVIKLAIHAARRAAMPGMAPFQAKRLMSAQSIRDSASRHGTEETVKKISEAASQWRATHNTYREKYSQREQRKSVAGIPQYLIRFDGRSTPPRWIARFPKDNKRKDVILSELTEETGTVLNLIGRL